MNQASIVFIDSGVGGLPYYGAFRRLGVQVPAAYVADRANFPYGPKSKDELVSILVSLTDRVLSLLHPSLIVVACNTASVSALEELRKAFPALPFVGTVPAVKPAALYSVKRRIGVLATERTVRDPYVSLLADRFAPGCALVPWAAPELVEFVEVEYPTASAETRRDMARRYMDKFRAADVDAVVLGCTHFLFLAEEFQREGGDQITVFDSRLGVAQRARKLLAETLGEASVAEGEGGGLSPGGEGRDALFVTGGDPYQEKWGRFASLFDLVFSGSLEGTR